MTFFNGMFKNVEGRVKFWWVKSECFYPLGVRAWVCVGNLRKLTGLEGLPSELPCLLPASSEQHDQILMNGGTLYRRVSHWGTRWFRCASFILTDHSLVRREQIPLFQAKELRNCPATQPEGTRSSGSRAWSSLHRSSFIFPSQPVTIHKVYETFLGSVLYLLWLPIARCQGCCDDS